MLATETLDVSNDVSLYLDVFGRMLLEHRQREGLTQNQMADKLGMGKSRYCHYETNSRLNANFGLPFALLCKFAGLEEKSVAQLLAEMERRMRPTPQSLPPSECFSPGLDSLVQEFEKLPRKERKAFVEEILANDSRCKFMPNKLRWLVQLALSLFRMPETQRMSFERSTHEWFLSQLKLSPEEEKERKERVRLLFRNLIQ